MSPAAELQPVFSANVYSSASCGLSIVSAYANGGGVCLALDLRIRVAVSVYDNCVRPAHAQPSVLDGYLAFCAERACGMAGRRRPAQIRAQVSSSVPPSKGLKTSAAVGSAFVGALFGAMNIDRRPSQVVAATTEAAKLARKAQAMNLDDAWAAVSGGVVITDERHPDVVERRGSPEGVEVVIFIPEITTPAAHRQDRRKLMAPHRASFDALLSRLTNSGEIYGPMTDAAFITARAFGYSEEPLALALERGALGVSLSGKGPAVGAICRRERVQPIISAWEHLAGRIIRTRPSNTGLSVWETGARRSAAEREVA